MDTFNVRFDTLPEWATFSERRLASPPGLSLVGPEAGQINLVIAGSAVSALVTLSDVHPPLADVWLWSLAVAWGLGPAAVRLDGRSEAVYLLAHPVAQDVLSLELLRLPAHHASSDPLSAQRVGWLEPRTNFLRRWGRMWCNLLTGPFFDRRQWGIDPEPMRGMPWNELGDAPALEEAPTWSRAQRIAWFYFLVAYHLRSRNHFPEGPAYWRQRELSLIRFSLLAAQAGWRQLRADAPPEKALQLIDEAEQVVRRVQANIDGSEEPNQLERELGRAYFEAIRATLHEIADIVAACLPLLPIGPGSFFADKQARRAVILRADGREWLLYWDDRLIRKEGAFHLDRLPAWRWPVATGPCFDRNALDPIDARLLRFLELNASPIDVVCPVCGYPCMDDDWMEAEYCEFCGFALYKYVGNGHLPGIRQYRKNFLRWGDVLPPGFPRRKLGRWRKVMLTKAYRQLAREAMIEWDAWLKHPDPDHKPEEVWRRWNRLQGLA
ncbi:MAG: hypothetical protein N3C63_08600 [Rhodocyclaceae bacterium]|nr:hypothetical protein [Rhodocyclaceae bacterium]